MNKLLYLLPLLIVIFACGEQPRQNSQDGSHTILTPASVQTTSTQTVIHPTQTPLQNNYSNSKYGYSLDYPSYYSVSVISDEYVELGEKIVIEVWDRDPTAPYGDGPVIESITDVQLSSGYSAKLLTGYIGAVGGYIPQQFRRYIVKRNSFYFVVTLYALGLNVTEGNVSQIEELDHDDISPFDSIVSSMLFR